MKIDAKAAKNLLRNAKTKLPENISKAQNEFAMVAKNSIASEFELNKKKAPRPTEAFKVKQESKFHHTVSIPKKYSFLDSMTPHYVALRRGRLITRWASRYFDGSHGKTGRSRVNKRKGVTSGLLYVTPDPFIDKGYEKALPKLQPILSEAVKRSLRG